VEGSCRRLHNEELHNLYASANIVRVIKLGTVRWAENVACIREMRNSCKILLENLKGDTMRKT
jgi:hypothetical protein